MSQYYQDPHGGLHFLDDVSFVTLLPAGCIEITPAQALAIQNPPVSLSQAQLSQNQLLQSAYVTAVAADVTYTSKAGVAKTYQADNKSIANLQALLIAFQSIPASLPPTFYWVASDNTQVPFTYADMQALAQLIAAQGITAFAHLQTQKALIAAATTVAAVQAINY